MKTSNVKPTFSAEQAKAIPAREDIIPESFKQLTEGHFSQVFSYETTRGEKKVLRLGRKKYSFKADKFAPEHFNSPALPVPKILEIGQIEPSLFYCISEFVPGTPSDQLPPEDLARSRESMEEVFVAVFKTDISGTTGSGDINTDTGNAEGSSFQEALRKEMDDRDLTYLREHCAKNGIDPSLVDKFAQQFEENIGKAQADRRLIHGDLGSDNVLVEGDKVTAVLDWSGMGYGDWLHDYSRLEFWYPGRHVPAREFAEKHGLETDNFEARWLAHMSAHALSTLDFAFRYESQSTIDWLSEHLASKLGAGNT